MISRFLAKVVISIVVLGFAAIELGSPLVVRLQLDGIAHDVADEAARVLGQSRNAAQARATAEQIVVDRDATLRSFEIDTAETVNVTVAREAPSIVLKKVDAVKSWYDVSVAATAPKRGS
ncbi:MAG TPA: hypothetical protein VK988_16415 [Acidimicrobiales bacterium]|nr:hypothetical protein [Acidimicrobiales bacterium]